MLSSPTDYLFLLAERILIPSLELEKPFRFLPYVRLHSWTTDELFPRKRFGHSDVLRTVHAL